MRHDPGSTRAAGLLVRLATCAALVAAVSACHGGSGGDGLAHSEVLDTPGRLEPAVSGIAAPTTNAPIAVGVGTTVCVKGRGAVTLVGVRASGGSDNFAVEDFAVRPGSANPGGPHLGDMAGTLEDAGFDPAIRTVDAPCVNAPHGGDDVAIQVSRTGPGPATSRGFDLDWRAGHETGTLRIPLAVVLCDASDALPERCNGDDLLGS